MRYDKKHLKGRVYFEKSKGSRYNQEFKQMIVEIYDSTERTYASLEGEYGIPAATIQRWVKQLTPIQVDNNSITPQEIKASQKEMAKLREKNEIFKKAMTILAKK